MAKLKPMTSSVSIANETIMIRNNYWVNIEEYALNIDLFIDFWNRISNNDISGHLVAIEKEMLSLLPQKDELKSPKFELPWEKMKFIAFYDDLTFSKRYLEMVVNHKPVVIIKEAFTLLDDRYKLITSIIKERFES